MEIEGANTFTELIKGKHKDIKQATAGYLLMKHYHMQEQAKIDCCCAYVAKRLVWKSNAPIQQTIKNHVILIYNIYNFVMERLC